MNAGGSCPCTGVRVAIKHTPDTKCSDAAFLACPLNRKVEKAGGNSVTRSGRGTLRGLKKQYCARKQHISMPLSYP